jgi:hypothetical protein
MAAIRKPGVNEYRYREVISWFTSAFGGEPRNRL